MTMLEYVYARTLDELLVAIEDYFNTSWLRPKRKVRLLLAAMRLKKDATLLKKKLSNLGKPE
jgi:hypothetical protein